MTQRHAPLLGRLRRIDPGRADRQTRLIAALNARTIGSETLTARIAVERDRRAATSWIRFRTPTSPVAIAPLLVGGELARMARGLEGADPASAAALLARIEPVVGALEETLGVELYPEGLDDDPPPSAVLLRLDASDAGGMLRHRVVAALPELGTPPAATLPLSRGRLGTAVALPWRGIVAGPSLRLDRVEAIGSGDLMLLGVGPLVAALDIPGRAAPVAGRIDITEGRIILADETTTPASAGAGAPIDDAAWNAVRVPTTIEIEGTPLGAADVAGLAPGSVLPLPAGNGTLSVRVAIGGRTIGNGELVAIGDGFGVLFTSVAGGSDAAPANG